MTGEEIERELRKEWWLNHGHDFHALYGDDGEMSCGSCPADFKRDDIDRLQTIVRTGRLERGALAAAAMGLAMGMATG